MQGHLLKPLQNSSTEFAGQAVQFFHTGMMASSMKGMNDECGKKE
jgi:hypothetical protein